jgi:hypothetical protein
VDLFFRATLFVLFSAASLTAQSVDEANEARFVFPADRIDPASNPGRPWDTTPAAQTTRPKAISYSNGYYTRNSIHRYASYATLPLFVAQFAVGQKLYDNPGDSSLKSAHSGLVAGTAFLLGINGVTGVWNLMEAKREPSGRGRRLFHGILMVAADAGFVATGALAPEGHDEHHGSTSPSDGRSTHRAVALTSMGIATASYLFMLFTR